MFSRPSATSPNLIAQNSDDASCLRDKKTDQRRFGVAKNPKIWWNPRFLNSDQTNENTLGAMENTNSTRRRLARFKMFRVVYFTGVLLEWSSDDHLLTVRIPQLHEPSPFLRQPVFSCFATSHIGKNCRCVGWLKASQTPRFIFAGFQNNWKVHGTVSVYWFLQGPLTFLLECYVDSNNNSCTKNI